MPATDAAATMPSAQATTIARAFLPPQRLGNRAAYYYVRSKLASDPLYGGICATLRNSRAPLLDLGCGLGLLAHALRQAGLDLPYRGVDNDARKIALARTAAGRRQLGDVSFELLDLAAGVPAHQGNVALLDVLQFVSPQAQDQLLDAAIAMLTPGACLVLRTGLEDGSWRARVTRSVDSFSRWTGWMNAGPRRYPDPDDLRARFAAAGLHSEFSPLFGRTPFNNWRIVATKPEPTAAG